MKLPALPEGLVACAMQRGVVEEAVHAYTDIARDGFLVSLPPGGGGRTTASWFIKTVSGIDPVGVLVCCPEAEVPTWRAAYRRFFPDFRVSAAPDADGDTDAVFWPWEMMAAGRDRGKVARWLSESSHPLVVADGIARVSVPPDGAARRERKHLLPLFFWNRLCRGRFVLALEPNPMPNASHGDLWWFLRHALQADVEWETPWFSWDRFSRRFLARPPMTRTRGMSPPINADTGLFEYLLRKVRAAPGAEGCRDLPRVSRRKVMHEVPGAVHEEFVPQMRRDALLGAITKGRDLARDVQKRLPGLAMLKATATADWVAGQHFRHREPMVVYSELGEARTTIARRLRALGLRAAECDGGMSADARREAVRGWSRGGADVFVSDTSGFSGTDLSRATRLVFAESSCEPGFYARALGRLRSPGDGRRFQVDHVVVADSLDESLHDITTEEFAREDWSAPRRKLKGRLRRSGKSRTGRRGPGAGRREENIAAFKKLLERGPGALDEEERRLVGRMSGEVV